MDLGRVLGGAEAVFHLAAQAGVRRAGAAASTSTPATTSRSRKSFSKPPGTSAQEVHLRVVVLGLRPDAVLPMAETNPVQPLSPYGVSKLAAEQLCFLYFKNFGLPTVSLRFFTVYGPSSARTWPSTSSSRPWQRTRVHRIRDGRQTRDFTFVTDVVRASLAALEAGRPGRPTTSEAATAGRSPRS